MCKRTSEPPDSVSVLNTGISEQAQGPPSHPDPFIHPTKYIIRKENTLAGTSMKHSFISATSEHPKIKYPQGKGWIITQSCLNVSKIGFISRDNWLR